MFVGVGGFEMRSCDWFEMEEGYEYWWSNRELRMMLGVMDYVNVWMEFVVRWGSEVCRGVETVVESRQGRVVLKG